MRRYFRVWIGVCFAALVALSVIILQFSPSALPEPGNAETAIANRVLRILVWRQARRESIPDAPADRTSVLNEADKLFGVDCAGCHGSDGHSPTDAGRWMYPRSASLISHEAQNYSDRELFWIVKNGIRMTGMPAFGKVETDENIWSLVLYLRSLSPRGSG